ncbi:MAG: TetR family transcriptional regulator [Acidimicrobiales bacterium]
MNAPVGERRTQARRRQEAVDRLLDAAAELIADGGLASITLAKVGERAGFSRGAANHHFGTKAGLIEALIHHVEREFVEATTSALPLEDPLDSLVTASAVFLRLVKDPSATHRAFLVLWGSAVTDADLRVRMAALDRNLRNALARLVRQGASEGVIGGGVEEQAFAVGLLGQLRGVALQHLIDPDGVDLDLVAGDIERSIRLLGAGPSSAL